MSASETDICNLALFKYGDKRIDDINEGSTEANTCKVLYPQLRDYLIARHPWNFAMTRADISAQLATTPAFEWDYAYQLPNDCLRVWELYGTDSEWVVESGELLTNQDEEIYIRYIKQVTTTGKFSQPFVISLSVLMAAELSAKLSADKDRRLALLREVDEVWIPRAMSLNAMESNRPRRKGEGDLADSASSWIER